MKTSKAGQLAFFYALYRETEKKGSVHNSGGLNSWVPLVGCEVTIGNRVSQIVSIQPSCKHINFLPLLFCGQKSNQKTYNFSDR